MPNCCQIPDVFIDPRWRARCHHYGVCTRCGQIVLANLRTGRSVPLSYRAMRRLMRSRPVVYRELVLDQFTVRQLATTIRPPRDLKLKLLPLQTYLHWMARDRAEVVE